MTNIEWLTREFQNEARLIKEDPESRDYHEGKADALHEALNFYVGSAKEEIRK